MHSSLRTFGPSQPEKSAWTSGTIATKFPMKADILRNPANGSPKLPAPMDRLDCDFSGAVASIS